MKRKRIKKEPLFICINKEEKKETKIEDLKSSKWLNSEPQRCMKLLADLFTEKWFW